MLAWDMQMYLLKFGIEMSSSEMPFRDDVNNVGPYFDKSAFNVKNEGAGNKTILKVVLTGI